MRKILFIVNHFYPELGAIRTEYEISKGLSKEGYDIKIVTTSPRKYRLPIGYTYPRRFAPLYLEKVDGLNIYRINFFISQEDKPSQRILDLITTLTLMFITSLGIALSSDVIIVAGDVELLIAQIGILLKVFYRKPLVVILHDIHPDAMVKSGIVEKNSFVFRLMELLIRSFSKYVDLVIVHSNSNAFLLSKRYGIDISRIKVVDLWANIDEITPPTPIEKKMLKKKYLGDDSKFVVSFAGVMNPPQGLDVVIWGAKYLKDNYPQICEKLVFLLVGDGSDKSKLIDLSEKLKVKDMFVFLPFQPREKYIEILKLSDISLVTLNKDYIQPVVPSKLLEIMAAGCSVIISTPPFSDAVKIVKEHKCGLYSGNGSPQKLAESIVKLYLERDLLQELGSRGRSACEEYYNYFRAIDQYKNIINLLNKQEK